MPLFHCKKCHHEWEGSKTEEPKCDWCGAGGFIIEDKTPVEKMVDKMLEMGIEEYLKQFGGFRNDNS